jgi:hypothetical protein
MIYYFEPSDRGPWPADDGELENNDSLARCWVDRLRRMVDGAELGAGLAGKFKLERRVSVVALRGGSGSTCILVEKTKVNFCYVCLLNRNHQFIILLLEFASSSENAVLFWAAEIADTLH